MKNKSKLKFLFNLTVDLKWCGNILRLMYFLIKHEVFIFILPYHLSDLKICEERFQGLTSNHQLRFPAAPDSELTWRTSRHLFRSHANLFSERHSLVNDHEIMLSRHLFFSFIYFTRFLFRGTIHSILMYFFFQIPYTLDTFIYVSKYHTLLKH